MADRKVYLVLVAAACLVSWALAVVVRFRLPSPPNGARLVDARRTGRCIADAFRKYKELESTSPLVEEQARTFDPASLLPASEKACWTIADRSSVLWHQFVVVAIFKDFGWHGSMAVLGDGTDVAINPGADVSIGDYVTPDGFVFASREVFDEWAQLDLNFSKTSTDTRVHPFLPYRAVDGDRGCVVIFKYIRLRLLECHVSNCGPEVDIDFKTDVNGRILSVIRRNESIN